MKFCLINKDGEKIYPIKKKLCNNCIQKVIDYGNLIYKNANFIIDEISLQNKKIKIYEDIY